MISSVPSISSRIKMLLMMHECITMSLDLVLHEHVCYTYKSGLKKDKLEGKLREIYCNNTMRLPYKVL